MKTLVVMACLAGACRTGVTLQPPSIANSGFQETNGEAVPGWRSAGGFRAVWGEGHNGSGGLVWTSQVPSAEQEGVQQNVQLARGRAYRYTFQARTENFKGTADCCIEWYDAAGNWLGGTYLGARAVRDENSNWRIYEAVTREIPEEAVRCVLQIFVRKGSSGKVAFDNVAVWPRVRAAVQFMASSAYRDLAETGVVRFHVSLCPPDGVTAPSAWFAYRGADGRAHRVEPTRLTDDEAMLELPVARLALGTQDVTCDYFDDDVCLGSATNAFTRVRSLPTRRVAIDSRGRCLVDGKPFFPLGLYGSRLTDRRIGEDLSRAGFNCYMPYGKTEMGDLDLASEYGLRLFADVRRADPESAAFQQEVAAFARHPAFFAWYTCDEAPVTDIPRLKALYRRLVALDAEHPVWVAMDRTHDLREFTPVYDVLGVDPYPIGRVRGRDVDHVAELVRGARKAVFGDRPFWNIPQMFSWNFTKPDDDVNRFPTEAEMRSMTWQHIALGANGLVGYSYHDIVRCAKENPEEAARRWSVITNVVAEVAAKIPVLLSADAATQVTDAPKSLVARAWTKDGETWLLLCNIARQPLKTDVSLGLRRITVDLPPIGVSFARLPPFSENVR